jgi:hypothetical protein
MSDRSMWKMLHLLYTLRPGQTGLDDRQLADAGVDCEPDTVHPLEESGVVVRDRGEYSLTAPARRILGACVVANRRWSGDDMWVDYPSAFVIMPFSEPWSDTVYKTMIEPAVTAAGLECVRGDRIVRMGDLSQNIWRALLRTGVVVADVSALSANVFYELSLVHALGKDTVILRQANSRIPADIGGAHYHEYDLAKLDVSREWLRSELTQSADDQHSAAVKALREG